MRAAMKTRASCIWGKSKKVLIENKSLGSHMSNSSHLVSDLRADAMNRSPQLKTAVNGWLILDSHLATMHPKPTINRP